ncbi:MAG: signal recognition particle receptor subunit alpha, partial [Enterococcus viikkiensis]
MGLFDRIKKAFTGEKEAEKPEEVIEDQENSEVDADKGVETIDTEQTPEAEKEASPSEKTEKMTDLVEDTVEQQPEEETDLPVQEVEPESIESAQTSAELEEAEQATESLAEETELPEISPSEAAISPEPVEEPIEETVQEKYDKGLEKTRKSFGERMNELFARFRRVDEDFFEELEETLIGADVGFDTAIKLTDSLRQEVKLKNAKKPAQIQNVIIEKLVD